MWGGFPVLATSDGLQAQDEGSEVVRSNISRAGLGLGRPGGGSEEMQIPRQECSRMEDGGVEEEGAHGASQGARVFSHGHKHVASSC